MLLDFHKPSSRNPTLSPDNRFPVLDNHPHPIISVGGELNRLSRQTTRLHPLDLAQDFRELDRVLFVFRVFAHALNIQRGGDLSCYNCVTNYSQLIHMRPRHRQSYSQVIHNSSVEAYRERLFVPLFSLHVWL